MPQFIQSRLFMLLVAVLTPFLAVSIQWYFWDILNPLTWILLYPAVFFSASVGGLRGGALATLITVLLADFFFIPPSFTFYIENDRNLYSAIIFFLMGVLFSLVFEKLHKTLDEVHRLSKLELDRYINRLDQALAFADAGIWEWDVRSGEVFWSNSLWELYGLEANSCQATYENWLKSVALDDREPIQLAIQKAVAEKAEILLEWRVHSSLDQQTHYLMSRGQPELDDNGRLERYRGIVIDITARKLMEESLKTSESRLRLCQDSGGIGSWEANFIDDTQVWSQSCYKLLGVPENISLNWQGFLDLVHPDDRQLIINAVALHIHNGDKYEVDYRLDSSTNDFRWMRSVGQAERSAEGQLTIFRGIVQDITEQKKAELALKHSEAEFKLLAEAMPQIVWITRADGCNTFFNQQWFDYTGLTWEDSIGTNWTKPFHPDDRQRAWDAWQHAIQEHSVYALEARLKKYDGSYRWWLIRGVPVTNEQGEIRNWFGTCTDIDDIKATQAALSSAEKRWSFALEGSGQGVWDWDVATNRMNYSPLWKSILGYADQEFPNDLQAWLDRIHPDDHESVVGALDALTKGKTLQFDQEYRLRHRNNEYIWVSVRGMVFDVNTESLPMRLLGIQQNIHQRKLQDLELQQYHDHLEQLVSERTDALNEARERAEKLAEVKSAFLANMSHEIRTPMNAVLGFCYLLEQKSLDSDSRDLVVKIHNAGRNLLNIINDILDFSKIEAGRIDMESTPFHLHTLLEHVGAMMQSLAGSKRLELIISPPEEISGLIGDEQRLQQVLINLVGNAIKFTDDGEVSLLVTCEQAHDHDVRLRFSVKDTGIGMSEEQLTKLFQAFSQADASIGRRFGGTGLGLAISQRLIALMGGELQVNSHLDQGSEFWFVLPFERSLELAATPASLTQLDLLIADDNDMAREALHQTVKSLGWRADLVDSGEALIAQTLQRMSNQQTYDVLLVDWMMPTMDGLTAVQNLRDCLERSQTKSARLPIVLIVTAYSKDQLLSQLGMEAIDGVLTKPVTPSSLYDAVARLTHDATEAYKDDVTRITSNRIAGLRLLVVDDSDINREVAKRILESEGAIVTLAHDGQYALDWLLAHENVVDLVLMDIQMPRLDGYAATQKIRMHPKFSQLPILALTAGAFKSLQEAALEAGMNDFIAKPFNVDLMIGKIRHWTGHVLLPETPYQTPLVSTDSTGLSMLEPTTAKPDDSLPTLPGIDLAAGLKIWGDIKDLQTYLVRFLQQYQAAGHEIRAFFEQGNSAAIGTLAHKMKGAAFSVAATPIADLCRQIEECLNTPAELSQATDHLQAALDELQQALDTWLPVHHGPTPGVLDQQAIHDRWPTIAPMITELLQALDEDNPSHAEDILSQLERQLDSHYLNPIKAALTEFDFREAESLVRMLIGTFAP